MAKYDKNMGENLYHQAKRLINKDINLKTAERDTNKNYFCFEGIGRQALKERAVMCCSKCGTIKYFKKEDTKPVKLVNNYYIQNEIECPVCGYKLEKKQVYSISFNN